MTAEIVVMNREAVALAADSAVTIGGGPKVLNTVNKVFMLAPDHSVGILLYNNPDLMDIPWEILIKYFRDYIIDNKIQLADLEDYAEGFLNHIEQNGSKYITPEQEDYFVNKMLFIEYWEISGSILNKISDIFYQNAEISEDEINNIAIETIKNRYSKWTNYPDILPSDISEKFRKNILSKFEEDLIKNIKYRFEKFSLPEISIKELKDIGLYKISKIEEKPNNELPYTGIVFSGYGRENIFPVCISYEIYCYLCNTLVYREGKKCRIGFSEEERTAEIIPFGQVDVVRNIINGRLDLYEIMVKRELIEKLESNDVDEILNKIQDKIWEKHTQPIIDTIDVLPKDELASVARTLVNLTSFMRRVSSDVETVGGPVDVSVISKKDGFVWVDRKHYFDINKNLHFSKR